ncbi:MAG TPA: M23 family metallopeptidase [Candidatus Saccharimonadales bacterium]|nr:M23 family metallopeptidase [Candidatus Saccharimonadales bacterium]
MGPLNKDYDDKQNAESQTVPARAASPEDLKTAEDTASELPVNDKKSLAQKERQVSADDHIGYREERSPLGFLRKKSKKKKVLFLLGGSMGLGLAALFIVFIILIGSLKTVHFSTVLRSVGFARFQMYMRQHFAQTTFDAAVLTDESTGSASAKLGERSLLDKMRRINPEKQLQVLATENRLKFNVEENKKLFGFKREQIFKGVEIDGKKIDLDEISRRHSGGLTWKELNDITNKASPDRIRQRLAIRAEFVNSVRDGLADRLALEGRAFRNSVYDGLRQITGINMSKWLNKARDYLGKTAEGARLKNLEDGLDDIDRERVRPKSGLNGVQDAADEVADEAEDAAKEGRRARTIGELKPAIGGINTFAQNISDAVFVATVACVVHDLDNSFDESARPREEQAARFGHSNLTSADQIKKGDVASEAVGAENDRWDGANTAIYYKQATRQKVTKEDKKQLARVPSITPPINSFGKVIGYVNDVLEFGVGGPIVEGLTFIPIIGSKVEDIRNDVIDLACNAILNEYVQYGISAAEIAVSVFTLGSSKGVTAGIVAALKETAKFASTVGVGELIGQMIEGAISNYSGTEFSATSRGENLYNSQVVATDYLQQTGTRNITYGRPLSASETKASQEIAVNMLRDEQNSKSFSNRYFAIDNPFSLVGRIVATLPSGVNGMFDSVGNIFSSLLSNVFKSVDRLTSLVGDIFSGSRFAYAAASQGDYVPDELGVDSSGWSDVEFARLANDDNMNAVKVATYVEPRFEKLNEKYGKCFNYTLQVNKPSDCVKLLSPKSANYEESFRYRAYMAKIFAADELIKDIDAKEESATASGQGIGIPPGRFDFPLKTTKSQIEAGNGKGLVWCYDSQKSCHGPRKDKNGVSYTYAAADLAAPTGTPVVAVRSGTIIKANQDAGKFGATVRIKGDDGLWYYYAHMGKGTLKIKSGEVKAGQVLGTIGTAADAEGTTPHLHFDVASVDNSFSRPGPEAVAYCIDPQPSLVSAFKNLPE